MPDVFPLGLGTHVDQLRPRDILHQRMCFEGQQRPGIRELHRFGPLLGSGEDVLYGIGRHGEIRQEDKVSSLARIQRSWQLLRTAVVRIMAALRQLGASPPKSLLVLSYGTMACFFFAPDGMDSADFEPHFPSARLIPSKPTIRKP